MHSIRTCLHHFCKFLSCLRKQLPAKMKCPFFSSESSQEISFLYSNSIKAANLRKNDSPVSHLIIQSNPTQCLSTEQLPVSFYWQVTPQYPSTREQGTCYILPNKTWDNQPIIRRSKNPDGPSQICLDSPRKWTDPRGLCWYRGFSLVKERILLCIPSFIKKTVN